LGSPKTKKRVGITGENPFFMNILNQLLTAILGLLQGLLGGL
jgi:hypothetical protein